MEVPVRAAVPKMTNVDGVAAKEEVAVRLAAPGLLEDVDP